MATRLIALFVLAMSLLPIAGMLPAGEEDPAYVSRMLDWLNGLVLCVGVGALVVYIARVRRRRAPATARDAEQVVRVEDIASANAASVAGAPRDRLFLAVTAALVFALYAIIAHYVFSGRPLLIDEIVQVLQARWYAAGHLWMPVPALREFFSIMHLVDLGDKVFSQYPAGGPAMLALGSVVGAEWLVGPAAGAVSVVLFAQLLPSLEPTATRRWRRWTTVLFALAPFGEFMFASHMNHATSLVWLLLAVVLLARATRSVDASPWWAFAMGLALGVAATIRPMDGVAFALPAAGWLLYRARHGGRPLAALLASGIGVAIPLAMLFWVNAQTTGHALVFGYDQLWGSRHAIGFHESAWGPPHTPMRGVELISIYFTDLSTHLLETPFPAALLFATSLWLTRGLRALDKYLLWSAALVTLGYWAYWHKGDFLGPRFLFALFPICVIWLARFPLRVRTSLGRESAAWLGVRAALVMAGILAAVQLVAVRIPSYRNGLTTMRLDIARASAQAGVRDALVLVKESWGARLVVRAWALGVPRTSTERLYRLVDACRLELAITALEDEGIRGERAEQRLLPLLADSSQVVRSTRSPDDTEGMQPGIPYPPQCEIELERDWQGYTHLAPFRLAQDGNVYARWLPGRESEIIAQFPDRDVYLLSRDGPEVRAPLVWAALRVR